MSKKYFLEFFVKKQNHAGSKAVNDAEDIMRRIGYIPVVIKGHDNKYIRNISQYIQLRKRFGEIEDGSEFVVRHPIYTRLEYMPLLEKLKKRDVKLTFIINDLESLRNLPDFEKQSKEDEKMIGIADKLIVHNDKMKAYIEEKYAFPSENMVSLELFDYLAKGTHMPRTYDERESSVAVAGNLDPSKSGYVYELVNSDFKNIVFDFYGNGDKEKLKSGCAQYMGSFSPEDLPNMIFAEYGLVWDGPSIKSCEGNTGNYIKYNNPHKLSLYVAAGLPVIIWKQAALADFVTQKGIGITIDSIEELPEILRSITREKYEDFLKKLAPLTEKVRTGKFLETALG